jgi:hypothetical protein
MKIFPEIKNDENEICDGQSGLVEGGCWGDGITVLRYDGRRRATFVTDYAKASSVKEDPGG